MVSQLGSDNRVVLRLQPKRMRLGSGSGRSEPEPGRVRVGRCGR